MDFAQKGDIVEVDYTLKYKNGRIYDTTHGKEPVTFTLGEKTFLPGFEKAITGMTIGESKLVTLKAKDMFLEKQEDLITKVPLIEVPDHVNKKVGQRVRIDQENRPALIARISEVDDTHITLDANLPMSGQDFLLSVTLIDIARYED
tara:strand:+ start:655 stop:1095 length:441 start_codon:yes stop_codon:yes gene_type:complete